jgi:hypothetical protein
MSVKFSEFSMDKDSWKNYVDRFNYCLLANTIITDELKKANFLAVCGHNLYDLILSLISPKDINSITYAQIKSLLDDHFNPKQNEIVQSYKFHMRCQLSEESIKDYVAGLRKLAIDCNFADLDRTLRDRLVCGIHDKNVQKQLLQQSTLTFEQAIKLSLTAEVADAGLVVISAPAQSSAGSAPGGAPAYNGDEPMEINKMRAKPVESTKECWRCGKMHGKFCKFRFSRCYECKRVGHIAEMCSNTRDKGKPKELSKFNGLYEEEFCNYVSSKVPPFYVDVYMNDRLVNLEVDSGAAYTMIKESTALSIWNGCLPRLSESKVALTTWTSSRVALLGEAEVNVQFKNIKKKLNVLIAKGDGPNLLGRDWFLELNISVNGIFNMKLDTVGIGEILEQYKEVFQPGLGKYTGPVVTIPVKPNVKPTFLKCRPIAFAIKDRVLKEIDRLVGEDVLEPVSYSEFASPIVPIIKKNGNIRLCGDYRSTVNVAIETDTYPLPTLNEAFATLQGGIIFSKIDLEQAYTQVVVDDSTSKLLTLNTPKGLFKVKRLAFGVKACPGIFQRMMSNLLAGVAGTAVLLDDIVVSGNTVQEHSERLQLVLQTLKNAGLRVNKGKCTFGTARVQFLGFVVDADGLHPCKDKIEAITNTPAPRNLKELQAFLVLLNFYDRFLPQKATVAEPLYKLLLKGAEWAWSKNCQQAFTLLKNMLTTSDTLIHYDLSKPLVMTCDASQYGLGAVLEHRMDDGSLRPIMFASRTMGKHERNYAQIDKEAAAIVFGLKKFYQYIFGRSIVIRTDHKPLLGIFDPKKPIPNVISPRMLRWALFLSSYDYDLIYTEGQKIGNADALSRWPTPEGKSNDDEAEEVSVLLLNETPIELEMTAKDVAKLSRTDELLSKVMYWVRNGWPVKVEENFKEFYARRNEITEYSDCLLWGSRVILPHKLRHSVLQELHSNHDGIVITKAVARSYFWWPGLDKDIENMIQGCLVCKEVRNMPPKVTHRWISPPKPWSRLHVDFAGPFMGKVFLIVIDAHSKWPEVKVVGEQSSSMVISKLNEIFVEQGLPDTIVSDNGKAFVSEEIQQYFKRNGIRHILVPPYHPASNGQAERTVQTVKLKLKKMAHLPWSTRIQTILYGLRTTPSSVTGKTPAEMLNGRRFRTKFDRLHPLSTQGKETKDVENNLTQKVRDFRIGETVCFRNYRNGPRWLEGAVIKKIGIVRYKVKLGNKTFVRHVNQMLGFERNKNNAPEHLEKLPGEELTQTDPHEEDQAYGTLRIPSPGQWAEMIGARGPEDCVVNAPAMVTTRKDKNYKRSRSSESPPSAASSRKRIALGEVSSKEDEDCSEDDRRYSDDSVDDVLDN